MAYDKQWLISDEHNDVILVYSIYQACIAFIKVIMLSDIPVYSSYDACLRKMWVKKKKSI